MSAPVTRCEVGFRSDWLAWTVGEGPERSAALAARRTDDPHVQAIASSGRPARPAGAAQVEEPADALAGPRRDDSAPG